MKNFNKNTNYFTSKISLLVVLAVAVLFGGWIPAEEDSRGDAAGDWPAYGRDAGGSRYSPLEQINRENVKQLKIAWTYRTGENGKNAASGKKAAFEATPILVDGTLYLSTPFNRAGGHGKLGTTIGDYVIAFALP